MKNIWLFYFLCFICTLTSCNNKPSLCMLCGNFGYSRNIKESIHRGTFVKNFYHFKVLTDSLSYVELKKKIFLERCFKYGINDAEETVISIDSMGHLYQLGVSPAEGNHLSSNHRLTIIGRLFTESPDTIECSIWSYSVKGESSQKIGRAIIY